MNSDNTTGPGVFGRRVRVTVRACGHLVGGIATALPALVTLGLLPLLTVSLSVLLVGVLGLPYLVLWIRVLAGWERRRLSRYLGRDAPAAYRRIEGPASTRLRIAFTDGATGRDLLWLLFQATAGLVVSLFGVALSVGIGFAASVPLWWYLVPEGRPVSMLYPVDSWPDALGMLGLAAGLFGIAMLAAPPLAHWHARAGRRLLTSPTRRRKHLAEQVAELTASRAAALDAHGIELRRIERDLHDGVQNRLVAVTMHLGMVERALSREPARPATALPLVRDVQETAVEALAELRQVVRAVYPPILADRGLGGALAALAARCPISCDLRMGELPPIPAALEATGYFIVAESLTNAVKHSGASRVEVSVTGGKGELMVTVTDDGDGGADATGGTGLLGLRRRVEAHWGQFTLDSPPGGPTVIEAVLPCEW